MKDEQIQDVFSMILASSVHDMKNSLGMLLGSLEEVIAESDAQDDRQANQFATLQYEASRINSELIRLLSIYRMQQNRLPITIDEHFVDELLEDQFARDDTLFTTRGIQASFVCDSDLVWYFDAELVGSVINDALVNCARYTQDQIFVSATMNNHCLEITVSDNGPGFPAFMLGDQSSQENPEITDNDRTHLGLYFAGRVAEMHRRNDIKGSLTLANNGKLGGGELVLRLP